MNCMKAEGDKIMTTSIDVNETDVALSRHVKDFECKNTGVKRNDATMRQGLKWKFKGPGTVKIQGPPLFSWRAPCFAVGPPHSCC